jgi:hypothetical protein
MRPMVLALEPRTLLSNLFVNSANSGPADGLTPDTGFATIQAAISIANPGDTILVETGNGYNESDTVGVADLTIEADAGQAPVLDGTFPSPQTSAGFSITTVGVTLAGFTIQNFSGPSAVDVQSGSSLVLSSDALQGNFTSSSGGGVDNDGGSATLINCSISGNSAGSSGGGVYNDAGSTTLINCTVSGNSSAGVGGGVENVSGTVIVGNTILAENAASSSGPDAFGNFASQGNNLIGATDGSFGWASSDLTGTIVEPLDPLLAPMGNDGGPTQTMALLPGSPAIDAGNNALVPAGITTDQRGFPRIVNGIVDIGAFESSGFTVSVTSGSGQSTGVLTSFSAPLVVTVTANSSSEPVAGGLVSFTLPPSGASTILSGTGASIGADGTASVSTSANGIVGNFSVSATASGITTSASFSLTNDGLILALDPTASGALTLSGHASINVAGVVYVDSSSSSALSASGYALVSASTIAVHGKVQKSGFASLSSTPATGAPALAAATLPSPSTAGVTNYGSFALGDSSSSTIQPGIYTQISVSGFARLTMASGVYIIDGDGFSLSGSASVTGSAVMIVNAGSAYPGTGGTYGSILLSGLGTCNLSPMTSGIYAGIVFFQPPDNSRAIIVAANAARVTGTIYAPTAHLSEVGQASLGASLIVDTLTISGNGSVDSPTGAGLAGIGGALVTTFGATTALGTNVSAPSLPVLPQPVFAPGDTPVPQPAPANRDPGDLLTLD